MSEVALTDTAVADRRDSLIKPSTKREEVLLKIHNINCDKNVLREQRDIKYRNERLRREFINSFRDCCGYEFDLSIVELRSFSEEELKALAEILSDKTEIKSRLGYMWAFISMFSFGGRYKYRKYRDRAYQYREFNKSYKLLMQTFGDDWFPVEELKGELKQ